MDLITKIKNTVRDVPDFPKEGILFKDITPIFQDAQLSREIINHLKDYYASTKIDAIAGIESRGFLFGFALAQALDVPFVLIRKKGKLPYEKASVSYDLEYGSAEIEMHTDAFEPGANILIHDDLLATGGSANACAELIKQQKGNVVGFNFLIGLSFLNGNEALKKHSDNIYNLVSY